MGDITITKHTYFIPLFLFFLLLACDHTEDRLEQALQFAGDNRLELEKVLNYYQTDPKDSLKYQAAVFLIENMPYYYTLHHERLDQYRTHLYATIMDNHCTGEKAVEILEREYGRLVPGEYEKTYDSHVITSFYLINNIEQAFRVWEQQAWANRVSFDDFCEQILPYRIKSEPLENWRDSYYNTFQPLLDSLLTNKKDVVAAMNILYDSIVGKTWAFYEAIPLPYMGAANLLTNRTGNCANRTELATYIMRALGIPGGIDLMIQYPNRDVAGHSWNFVVDSLGQTIPFSLYEERPGQSSEYEQKRGKIYRKCFGFQFRNFPLLIRDDLSVPPVFRNPFLRDVSGAYFSRNEIVVPVQPAPDGILYLATFKNRDWHPITWTEVDNKMKQAVFRDIEKGIVCLPGYYKEGPMQPVSSPLLLQEDGTVVSIEANLQQKQTLVLCRKYPIQPWWRQLTNRPVGGRFQGANRPDFKDAVTFHTITDTLDMRWHPVPVTHEAKFRYVRYLSAVWALCNMAELRFFSDSLLTGKVIGTEGSFYNEEKYTKYAVFDNDPLTYYDAKEYDTGWAGLDLGTPQRIKRIEYLFRNDDNNIRVGDEYELFYWDQDQWNSMGIQVAGTDVLQYDNCPVNALFWLRNHTRGKEERIFTYENGKQIWW